jgi:ribosomal protein S19E (S16A)
MQLDINDTHVFWLEKLFDQKRNHRTASTIPVSVFNQLKALGCVTGEPGASSITAHGAGVLVNIRNDEEAAVKKEKAAKRKGRKRR